MPTSEERIEALERTLTNSVHQLNERINVLQQQIAEQKTERDQALVHLAQVIHQRFNQMTAELRQKFDASDHYAVITRGIVERQQQDIREMKEDVKEVKGRLGTLENKVDSLENKVDSLENKMDQRFDQLVALITKQNN